MPAMSRRPGPIETYVRELVSRYLHQKGHGAASALGRKIGRPASWVGEFARGRKRGTMDEGPALVRATDGDERIFVDAAHVADLPAIDPAQAHEEARLLRLFRRITDPERRDLAFKLLTPLAHGAPFRSGPAPLAQAVIGRRRGRGGPHVTIRTLNRRTILRARGRTAASRCVTVGGASDPAASVRR